METCVTIEAVTLPLSDAVRDSFVDAMRKHFGKTDDATKLEKMLFEKCKSEESYKRKVLNKIESISEKIIRDRAQKNMEAQGLKMAEAPAKRAKTE